MLSVDVNIVLDTVLALKLPFTCMVKSLLLNESAAGALQVDSSNAFNSLSMATASYS